jgi:lysophosphatidylcholine acyltransferase/lyso-PAF acetyltransferase
MSILSIIKYIFICPYLLICALLTYYIYKEEKSFYTPIYVSKNPEKEDKKEDKEKKVNIHDEFPCFRKIDKPDNIIRLFLGITFLGLFRVIINLFLAWRIRANIQNYLKSKNIDGKNIKINNEDIKQMIEITKRLTSLYLKFAGLIYKKQRFPDEKILPIYKKYFGPDYKIDYDGKFGCYISNHTCAYDMVISMALFGTGFVAKIGVTKIPVIGPFLQTIQSIFVDRSNTNSKNNILDIIFERQKDFFEGKPVMPFMIFPEGTTNSGRHLLPFKRGAFNSLLPVKATIILPNLYENYHLAVGSSDVGCNYLLSLSKLYNKVEYFELPIIAPNDYMYNNFGHLGKEKWEIFANVSREIMCELGGFQKSEFGIKDSFRYCSCIQKKQLLDRKSYKIE